MDKIMEKFNKLSLPAAILIASIALGGFFYASQVSKQKSIERQQEIKIEQEKIKDESAAFLLQSCLDEAKNNGMEMMNALLKKIDEGFFNNYSNQAMEETLAFPNEQIQKDKDECFKKYQQN